MSLARETRRLMSYGIASVLALAVDMGCYLLLIGAGMAAPVAAICGYSLGILVHWIASSRVVFHGRVASGGRERTAQKGLFIASALVGLALTWVIVSGGVSLGLDPRLAKLSAVVTSFGATFLLRARFVFALRPQPASGRASPGE